MINIGDLTNHVFWVVLVIVSTAALVTLCMHRQIRFHKQNTESLTKIYNAMLLLNEKVEKQLNDKSIAGGLEGDLTKLRNARFGRNMSPKP